MKELRSSIDSRVKIFMFEPQKSLCIYRMAMRLRIPRVGDHMKYSPSGIVKTFSFTKVNIGNNFVTFLQYLYDRFIWTIGLANFTIISHYCRNNEK